MLGEGGNALFIYMLLSSSSVTMPFLLEEDFSGMLEEAPPDAILLCFRLTPSTPYFLEADDLDEEEADE